MSSKVPVRLEFFSGKYVIVSGISGHTMSVPLYRLLLQNRNLSPKSQEVLAGLSDKLPVPGVDLLLGNDLCDGCVVEPIVSKVPVESSSTEVLEADYEDCLPSCVVARAMQNKEELAVSSLLCMNLISRKRSYTTCWDPRARRHPRPHVCQ